MCVENKLHLLNTLLVVDLLFLIELRVLRDVSADVRMCVSEPVTCT